MKMPAADGGLRLEESQERIYNDIGTTEAGGHRGAQLVLYVIAFNRKEMQYIKSPCASVFPPCLRGSKKILPL